MIKFILLLSDDKGFIYVADRSNHRIQKFDGSGKFIAQWGGKWGTARGRFNYPAGIALDRDGNMYISDTRNNRVQKLDREGRFITEWGKAGQGRGEFSQPYGITVDKSGNVYVADLFNHRVQKFWSQGQIVGRIYVEISIIIPTYNQKRHYTLRFEIS